MSDMLNGALVGALISALVSAGVTITVMLLSNRASERRLALQLAHDSNVRERERQMALRKETYLDAGGHVSRTLQSLSRIANLNYSENDLAKEIGDNFAALAKVQVVGNTDTVTAITALTDSIGLACDALTLGRAALTQRKALIEIQAELARKAWAEKEQVLEHMKLANLEGTMDKRRLDYLNASFQFQNKEHQAHLTQQHTLEAEQKKALIELIREAAERTAQTARFVPPALFAVRRELDLPLDEDAYLRVFNDSYQNRLNSLNAVLDKLQ
jgi:hypothetical protein